MGRGLRELVVIVVGAGALTALALGHLVIGVLLGLVVVFIGRRLVRHGRIIGVDQRAADQEGPPTIRARSRRLFRL